MHKLSFRTKFHEKYHDNCHDYLKKIYLEKYADPKYKSLLYKIKATIPKIDICIETPYSMYGNIIVCDQHAVVFTHALDRYPVLATYALNACVGLIMYCSKYKVAALAHIDGLPGYSKKSAIDDGLDINFNPVYENIKSILKNIRHLCNTNDIISIDYYLIGGIFNLSEVMVNDIIDTINSFGNTEYGFDFAFRGRNLLGPDNQSRNICIDSTTGKITHFDYLSNSEYHMKRVNKQRLADNIIKANRESEAFLDITYIAKQSKPALILIDS